MPLRYRKPTHKIPEITPRFIKVHKKLGHSDEYIQALWAHYHRKKRPRSIVKITD